ncbi:MAG TPA: polyprenyl diphosphate synthase [Acidobacteriota bacterium]|nr:polyprenyl diphosphate synthase [Acidobacteriota bacterium]
MDNVNHLAIIMDGNGRWAERRGLPRWKGHEMGLRAVRRLAESACRRRIPVVSLFAFSSENWKRPEPEVNFLFDLFKRYLGSEQDDLVCRSIRISAFGRRDRIPGPVLDALTAVEEATKNGRRLHLRIALDYGARWEIAETARTIVRELMRRGLSAEAITEALFADALHRDGVPDPDLIIRTSGERRLSNFLLWQAAYSELYFCPKMWPDFDDNDLETILADFHARTRTFGALASGAAR